MPVALIAIGVPGSGKTTFLKHLAADYGLVYINKDEIREKMLGDVNDQSRNREVWAESERQITEALAAGKNVALDATYAERWKRERLIASLRERGAGRVVGLYFDIPFERAQKQNLERERVVSDTNMEWFRNQLAMEPPELAEGYDMLYTHENLEKVRDDLG
jgi:predicted kinase